jgi:hypothetical protein
MILGYIVEANLSMSCEWGLPRPEHPTKEGAAEILNNYCREFGPGKDDPAWTDLEWDKIWIIFGNKVIAEF